MSTCTDTDTPRVWIGCLAAYNAGHLHGKWTDAVDAGELHEAAQEVLRTSPVPMAEEIALMDREGFGNLISEWDALDRVAEIGAAIEEHGKAFLAFCSCVLGSIEGYEVCDVVALFEDAQCGEWDSLKDYAEDYAHECLEIPDHLASYIDYDAIARDLDCDGYTVACGFVFRPV